MRRLIVSILSALVFANVAFAQKMVSEYSNDSFSTPGIGKTIRARGVLYHSLTWSQSGDLLTCTIKLEKSANGTTWSDLIAAADCTAAASGILVADNSSYVRANVTGVTGGGSITPQWKGYSGEPVRRSARTATGTLAAGLRQDVTITWSAAFPSTDYVPVCSVLDESASGLGIVVERMRAKTLTGITVQVFNGALLSDSGTVECVALWPAV